MKNETIGFSRRSFLAASLATGAGLSITSRTLAAADPSSLTAAGNVPNADKPLRILILGGTSFLGPALVDACKARGHTLTLFNRGKTEKRIGVIDGVEKIVGNRDPEKPADDADPASPKGLSMLAEAIKGGAAWDAVIDTSGYVPRVVRASCELLEKAAPLYCFVSTVSVYADNATPHADEAAPLIEMADATNEEVMGNNGQNYGGLKALCEREVMKRYTTGTGSGAINIRPGFIVGPGDSSDRFTYWPVRASKATKEMPDMIAPGSPNDPVQVVDVRDLAAFCLRCIEQKTLGTFNVTGPVQPMTWGGALGACGAAAVASGGAAPNFVWVPYEFLEAQQVRIGQDTPICLPGEGETAGFHTRSIARAVGAGLATRPLVETCKDLIAWWPKEVARRDRVGKQMIEDAKKAGKEPPTIPDATVLRAGMGVEKEQEVLAAWAARERK